MANDQRSTPQADRCQARQRFLGNWPLYRDHILIFQGFIVCRSVFHFIRTSLSLLSLWWTLFLVGYHHERYHIRYMHHERRSKTIDWVIDHRADPKRRNVSILGNIALFTFHLSTFHLAPSVHLPSRSYQSFVCVVYLSHIVCHLDDS